MNVIPVIHMWQYIGQWDPFFIIFLDEHFQEEAMHRSFSLQKATKQLLLFRVT